MGDEIDLLIADLDNRCEFVLVLNPGVTPEYISMHTQVYDKIADKYQTIKEIGSSSISKFNIKTFEQEEDLDRVFIVGTLEDGTNLTHVVDIDA